MMFVMMLMGFKVSADSWDNAILEIEFLNSPTPIEVVPTPITIDEKEIKCLAKNIYFEAGHEPYAGKLAVAQVTQNRVESGIYPDSYCGVVWHYTTKSSTGKKVAQFSWTLDGKPDIPRNMNAWEIALEIAQEVLLYNKKSDIIGKDVYNYHAVYVRPDWAGKMKLVTRIGNHKFYKDK